MLFPIVFSLFISLFTIRNVSFANLMRGYGADGAVHRRLGDDLSSDLVGWAYEYYFDQGTCNGDIDFVFAISTNKCLTVYSESGLPEASLLVSCTSTEISYTKYSSLACSGSVLYVNTTKVGCSKGKDNTNYRNSSYVGCSNSETLPLPYASTYTTLNSVLYLYPYEFKYAGRNCTPNGLESTVLLSQTCVPVRTTNGSNNQDVVITVIPDLGIPYGSFLYEQITGTFRPPPFTVSESDDSVTSKFHAPLAIGLSTMLFLFLCTAISLHLIYDRKPPTLQADQSTSNPIHTDNIPSQEKEDEVEGNLVESKREASNAPEHTCGVGATEAKEDNDPFVDFSPPFSPRQDNIPLYEDYTYKRLKDKDYPEVTVASRISKKLMEDNYHYIAICISVYNETVYELCNTIETILQGIEYMKNYVRLHHDSAGSDLHSIFQFCIPIIVPIFDGIAEENQIHPTTREWLKMNFNGIFTGLRPINISQTRTTEEIFDAIGTRVGLSKWNYKYDERLRDIVFHSNLNSQNYSFQQRNIINSNELPVTKYIPANKYQETRKLDRTLRADSKFCFDDNEDKFQNLLFYMVPIIKVANYRKHNSHEWFFRAICQGITGNLSTVFLTDCSTVFDQFCLAKLFTELYLKPDIIGVTARQRVCTPCEQFHPCLESPFSCLKGTHDEGSVQGRKPCWKCWFTFCLSPAAVQGFEFEGTLLMYSSMFNVVEALPVMPGPCQALKWELVNDYKVVDVYFDFLFKNEKSRNGNETRTENSSPLSFSEFLRITGRIAEDRFLSFSAVFATGYGTKWIPGATFYYLPEIRWQSLLTQRRRWINGTFGSSLFFFSSSRAKRLMHGALHDSHKFSKSERMIHFLWSLQLYQLLLALLSPAIFGSAIYVGMEMSAHYCPELFYWYHTPLFLDYHMIEVLTVLFMTIYAAWTLCSFYNAKIAEWICQLLAVIGFIYVLPIQFTLWYSMSTVGITVISGLVIFSFALPIILSIGQSFTSGALYFIYLWWFLSLILFYLVFIPSYSFARLHDTTWGNRTTGADSAIDQRKEAYLKAQNWKFNLFIISLNFFLTWVVVAVYSVSSGTVITLMIILLLPILIQLVFSLVYLFIVLPLRTLFSRPEKVVAVTRRPNKNERDSDERTSFLNGTDESNHR